MLNEGAAQTLNVASKQASRSPEKTVNMNNLNLSDSTLPITWPFTTSGLAAVHD